MSDALIETKVITLEEAKAKLLDMGYEPDQLVAMDGWLVLGKSIIIYVNHDLGSLGSRILGFATSWWPDTPLPRHAPDGSWGLGWRYLPEYVVLPEEG